MKQHLPNTDPQRQRVHSLQVLDGMHSLAPRVCIGGFSSVDRAEDIREAFGFPVAERQSYISRQIF